MKFENLEFTPMQKSDVEVLTPIMKRAFDEDSRLYFEKSEGGPDGYDDGSFLLKWGIEANSISYRVDSDEKTIGGIIVFIDKEKKEGALGCIFVDSNIEGKGFGSTMWHFIENQYPEIDVWHTETPAVSYRNHCFYINKLGFHVVAVEGGRDNRFDAQFKFTKKIR